MTAGEGVGHSAPFATRIIFDQVEDDGRFELQLVKDGEVLAFALVDAALAERLAYEAGAMAARCRAQLSTRPSDRPIRDGGERP